MKIRILHLAFFGLAFSVVTSCETSSDETTLVTSQSLPEVTMSAIGGSQTGLDTISLETAQMKAYRYGHIVGLTDSTLIDSVPRYYDVSIASLDSVIKYSQTRNPNGSGKIRIYVGRQAERLELMLVPLNNGSEDLDNIYNLITPCPTTCGIVASALEESYIEGTVVGMEEASNPEE